MRFRIELTVSEGDGPQQLIARCLDPGHFVVGPNSTLGGAPLLPMLSQPRSLLEDGSPDLSLFTFTVAGDDVPESGDVVWLAPPGFHRDEVDDPSAWVAEVAAMRSELVDAPTDKRRLELLGLLGDLLRLHPGAADEALERLEEAVALAKRRGDARSEALNRLRMGVALRYAGHYSTAERTLAEALELVDAGHIKGLKDKILQQQAQILVERGQLDEAERATRQALRLVQRRKGDGDRRRWLEAMLAAVEEARAAALPFQNASSPTHIVPGEPLQILSSGLGAPDPTARRLGTMPIPIRGGLDTQEAEDDA